MIMVLQIWIVRPGHQEGMSLCPIITLTRIVKVGFNTYDQ
jgi:hypothetical protein